MTKQVTVEELSANLATHLAAVERGETVDVIRDGKTIANLTPSEPVTIIRHDPALRLQDFEPGPRPKRLDFDSVELLVEERERDRSGKK